MKRILPFLLIAILVFAAYAPAIKSGFVWDDTALILRDPFIRSWRLIPEGFQHFLFTDAAASGFYRPIQRLTYTLDYAAFAFRPLGYHVASILYHTLAAAGLLLLASELVRESGLSDRARRLTACGVTLAWALHPLHSAVVAYVSGRADALAAAFGFFGLYLALRALRSSGASLWLRTVGAAALFLLSALSKEIGLVFLALWLTCVLLRRNWRATLHASICVIFVAVVYLSLRFPAQQTAPPPPPPTQMPLLLRPVIAARAFAEYAGLLALPLPLHMERDVQTHPTGFATESMTGAAWHELQTLLGILLIAAVIYWAVRSRKRAPAVFACVLLSAISYLPVCGLFVLNATVAEHWVYVPSAFLFLALGGALAARVEGRKETAPRWFAPLALLGLSAWIIFLGARTFLRTLDWKDQRTFLERTIADGGNSARMLINLAGLELSEGRLDRAKAHLQMALRKEPEEPLAVLNLAAVAVKQNDFKNAHDLLARATQMPLVEAQAHELLAILEHKETGRVNLLRLRLASHTGPSNWAIERRYIKALDEAGALPKAIAELQAVLGGQWYRAESWQLLGDLLAKADRNQEAGEARIKAGLYDVHLIEH